MRLVLAEIRLVQVVEMRLVPWVPPAFLEGGGGGGGGQDRARGRHLTATNMLSAFGGFNQRGEGVAVRFQLIQPAGWVLSVCFRLIQPAGGAVRI